jgi:hypothetical protein
MWSFIDSYFRKSLVRAAQICICPMNAWAKLGLGIDLDREVSAKSRACEFGTIELTVLWAFLRLTSPYLQARWRK